MSRRIPGPRPLTRRSVTRRIILHHAAAVTCTAQQIHQWHLANGWAGIGYHFFVRKDGRIYRGRPEDTVGAHAGNNNYDSIGICFEGSFDREQMNEVQRTAGAELVAYLKQKYGITTVQRHSDVNATGCPGGNFPFEAIANGGGAEASAPAQTVRTANDTAVTLPLLTKGSSGNTVWSVPGAAQRAGPQCRDGGRPVRRQHRRGGEALSAGQQLGGGRHCGTGHLAQAAGGLTAKCDNIRYNSTEKLRIVFKTRAAGRPAALFF